MHAASECFSADTLEAIAVLRICNTGPQTSESRGELHDFGMLLLEGGRAGVYGKELGLTADEQTPPIGPVAPPPPPPRDVDETTEEGVLKEALTRLFDKARSKGWQALGKLALRPFEPGDAFTLSELVELVAAARKTHRFDAEYEGKAGTSRRLALARRWARDGERPTPRDARAPRAARGRASGPPFFETSTRQRSPTRRT